MSQVPRDPVLRALRRGLLFPLRLIRRILRRTIPPSRVPDLDPVPLPKMRPDELKEIRRHFPMPKFFVLGHGRSGTTLLARLLRLHPEVHCNWQAHFFTKRQALTNVFPNNALKAWLERSSNRWTAEEELETSILRVVCDFIMEREAQENGKRIVGDKSPDSSAEVAVETLYRVYPDASILHIVRDGRDAILSRRMQLFVDAPSMFGREDLKIRESLQRDAEGFYASGRSIFTESWLSEAARGWALNVGNTDALARELYSERYLSIRYEDLIQSPQESMEKVWAFLEASPVEDEIYAAVEEEMGRNPAVAWQEQKAPRIVVGLERGSSGAWRQVFTEKDRRLFAEAAGEELQRWGYEVGER